MRRRERSYINARSRTFVVLFTCLLFILIVNVGTASAISRYDTLVDTANNQTSQAQDASSNIAEPESPKMLKEELDLEQFNNEFIDTAIFIIGILAGLIMMLELAAFCATRVFPSLNKIVEKLSFLGIDGYDRGFLVPTIKILLLGLLSYFCVSGLLKQAIAYILGWFVVLFQGG